MGRRAFRRNDVIDQQSRSQTEPIPAATRNVHLDNATSGATFTRTVQPSPRQDNLLSRPVEDCEGCPALAGVRNLGLDDPSAGRPDSHCNFGDRSIRACRAAAARRAKSLKRGCTGRTVRRDEWQALAQCVARGGDHAATGARHDRCLKLRVQRSWLVVELQRGRDGQAATRRGAHCSQRSNNARIRALPRGALRAGSRTSGRKSARRAPRLCEALQNH